VHAGSGDRLYRACSQPILNPGHTRYPLRHTHSSAQQRTLLAGSPSLQPPGLLLGGRIVNRRETVNVIAKDLARQPIPFFESFS
jgi:hypothetical protein